MDIYMQHSIIGPIAEVAKCISILRVSDIIFQYLYIFCMDHMQG